MEMKAEATLPTGESSSAGVQLPVPTTGVSSSDSDGAQLATPRPSPPAKKQRGLVDTPDPDAEVIALSFSRIRKKFTYHCICIKEKSLNQRTTRFYRTPNKVDRPLVSEVIALSPETLLVNRFVCEVCHKGFQREQNLQLHRRGHNLPWKLKQKNPLQAQRRRVYLCPEKTCVHHDPARAFGDLTGIKKHFCRKHGVKKWKCGKCDKRYAVQSDLRAHSKTCGAHEYRCDCGTLFSRKENFINHRAFCDAISEEMSKLTAVLPLQEIHGLGVGGGVGLPERDLPYKSLSLSLASDLKQVSSPEADELKQVSLRGATAHNYWLEHGLMNAEVHDGKQFTPSPHMSAFSLLQKPLQMGATSSSSSSLINKQEIIERVKEEHEYEDMKIGVDTEHGGIVGRADEKRDIMKLIMSHGPSNKRFTIICITGGHGLGKTTLASLVYWDDTMCRSFFEARAWMCLSHVTNIEELLRSTVSSLTGVSCRLNDRDELEELVKEELMGKKFLLVLDDLHENNVEICRRLILLLSVGDKGSAVMVTTSTNMVVGSLGTAHAYNLKPFMHDEFLNMATPHSVQYSPLKSIVSRMPSEFFGFPTFAKAIRGIIYSAFTREHLELDECLGVTLDGMLTDILNKPDNLLDNLLCLSYSYLRPNQQRCHAYCSLFPKDYAYNKEKLLRLWMSQGFIIPDREKDRDGDREDAFDDLLHRSFFDHCPASDFKEQKYVMHEFSSHAARTASGEKFFRAHDHELDCIPKDVHHLSIIPKQCDSEIYFSSFTEFRHLSTFLLVYNSQLDSSDSQFHVMDVKALDECFHNFRCLKTLDLSHTDIKELPESIGHMTSMCFLGLNNTNLRRLPNSICNLLKLQTLELQNSAFLVELPNNIKYLNSLHHLDASKEHGPIYVPPGIGQLKNLRTLTTFTVGGVSWSCKLSELAQLNSLRGSLHIQCLNDVENAGDAEGACLAAKKLNKLSLEWCYSGEDVESEDQICVAEHVLDALKPHSLLGELNIKGYYGLDLSSWMADHTLSDLSSITLDNCYNCKKLPPLGTLPALRSLFLQNLRAVQVISYEFYGNATINHKSFPKLETLKLRDMYNLEGWHDILLVGDFPLLHSLSIERCPKLRSIPRFQFISNASIMSCSRLNLPGLKSLQTLKFGNLKQGKCFTLSCELSSLLMLELICCEHLCSVEGLSRLQSLKHLKFRGCPRLNFDQDEPLPYTLETVDVHSNCYALINWRPHGFEELLDASEVYRKFIKRKCEDDKGVGEEVMQEP